MTVVTPDPFHKGWIDLMNNMIHHIMNYNFVLNYELATALDQQV